MSRRIAAHAAIFVLAAVLPLAAQARRPSPAAAASCSVAGNVVSATGLPTDEVVNFMVTDGTGTSGWVLGYTWDGTFAVTVPAPNGATSYQFVSRTWGPHGSKFTVFAGC